MDLGLAERVYIITGAVSPMGRACAQLLAAEGARVVLNATDASALSEIAQSLGGSERALAVPGNLAVPGIETALTAAAVARYGRLDGALVNLGLPQPQPASTAEDTLWQITFDTHFLGPLRLARTIGTMPGNEGMSIVLALAGLSAAGNRNALSSIHTALAAAARSLAHELGSAHVRVNTLIPATAPEDKSAASTGESSSFGRQRIPTQRSGDADELARPAVFLLSPAASYVTGASLTVDGGVLQPTA